MSDRKRELELCLEDITRWVIIPSAVNTNFSQICAIQRAAKSCLENDPKWTKIIDELKELKLDNGLLKIALADKTRLLDSCEKALRQRDSGVTQ